ncbi:MAG: helix-turn-helix transcriptional regulator, partial [Clostridia bacterium]|nr:helix-turn-helix transcriptional regulator [Clostridia bacterium]
ESKKSAPAKNGSYDIEEALALIHTNYHRQLTVKEAAQNARSAPSNFCAEFKRYTGMGFHEYLNFYRTGIAKFMLEQTDADIKEIAFTTGFSDIKTFYRVFKKETGFPPGDYRRVKK